MPVTISGTTGITGPDGSASTPSLAGADTNTGVFFPAADTVAIATGGTEGMRVDSSRNVGIGTSTPQRKLDVTVSDTTTAQLYLRNNNASYASGMIVYNAGGEASMFRHNGGSDTSYAGANSVNIGSVTNNVVGFVQNNTERARIDSSGNLLVGTTSNLINSDFRLQVNNSVVAAVFRNTPSSATTETMTVWNNQTSGDNRFIWFNTETGGTQRGSIDYNRGAGLVRYNTTSDATLKNIRGDASGAKSVEILQSTRIREYSWKDDPQSKPQIGVIAQELYETFKGAVSVGGKRTVKDEDGNEVTQYVPWAVDKTAFTFHLIAGWQAHEKMIQEQQALITSLTARIAALEGAAQ